MEEDLVIVARRNELKVRCRKPCCSDQTGYISAVIQW